MDTVQLTTIDALASRFYGSEALLPRIDHVALLNQAADIIDRFGFIQHDDGDPGVGFCVEGAIRFAAKHADPAKWLKNAGYDAMMAFARHVGATRPATWNDKRGRTKEEATAALRACAVIERAKQHELPKPIPVLTVQMVNCAIAAAKDEDVMGVAALHLAAPYFMVMHEAPPPPVGRFQRLRSMLGVPA